MTNLGTPANLHPLTQDFDHLPGCALVPVAVVMQVLGIGRTTVWRMMKKGELEAVKMGPRAIRFKVSHVRDIVGG